MPRKKRDGSPMLAPQRPALVIDRARYVGDPVTMVIAETLAQAKDAAELVVVDYDPLPSVTSVAEAAEADAPRVWDENPDNISHTTERGNRAATEAAFALAAHIVKRRYEITRVHAGRQVREHGRAGWCARSPRRPTPSPVTAPPPRLFSPRRSCARAPRRLPRA